jgi:hypothetical protein
MATIRERVNAERTRKLHAQVRMSGFPGAHRQLAHAPSGGALKYRPEASFRR